VPTPPLPEELQVEVTGACNLRCRMCLVRYAPAVDRREGALSFERYLELVDSLPSLRKLTLQGLGEPLLSPHLVQMVEHAARRGVRVGFNTNGTLLDRRAAGSLLGAGLGWLNVSLDGATAATYEDVRHGTGMAPRPGQFQRVVANLRGLVDARLAMGGGEPRIALVFVAMRRNVTELEALVELAADVGVDEVFVQNLSHTFSDTDPGGGYRELREYAEREALFLGRGRGPARLMERAARRAGELGLTLRLPRLEETPAPRRPGEPGCSWPWDSAYVTHEGRVQPCCMVMGSDRATLGSLRSEGFASIWWGRAYRRFRERLASDDPPAVCSGCSLYRGLF
jgi:radical SAM protein with 4Fe4S-binding SPASM domain